MPPDVRAAIEAAYQESRTRQAGRKLVTAIEAALRVAMREAVPEGTVDRLGAAVDYASGQAYVRVLDRFVYPEIAEQEGRELQQIMDLAAQASSAGLRGAADALRELAQARPDATIHDAIAHLVRLADERTAPE